MSAVGLYISAFVLSAFLPLSVLVLYVVLSRHVQLGPLSGQDAAVLGRFGSQAEREAFEADQAARWALRRGEVLGDFRRRLLARLDAMEPGRAAPYRARAARIGRDGVAETDAEGQGGNAGGGGATAMDDALALREVFGSTTVPMQTRALAHRPRLHAAVRQGRRNA